MPEALQEPRDWRNHDDAARFGAHRYVQHLRAALESSLLSLAGQSAVVSLVGSIEAALTLGSRLRPNNVSFGADRLLHSSPEDRRTLINQWSLGVGNPRAAVIVMGTEHAFDPFADQSLAALALESCASQLLWLADDHGDLASAVVNNPSFRPSDATSGYLARPTAYYSVSSGHTWRMVARVLGIEFERLFDVTYQVERSATAALEARRGVAPTDERAEFLEDLLRTLSQTASHLVLHGRMNHDEAWSGVNRRLAAAFAGVATGFEWDVLQAGELSVLSLRHSGRRVTSLPALSGRTRGIWAALEQMREIIGYRPRD